MCFLTKEWYGVPAYTVNLFIKAYHKITYKERCVLEMICFSLWFWLWCAFYNRSLKKHIILLSKYTLRLANKRIHIKLVSSVVYSNFNVNSVSLGQFTITCIYFFQKGVNNFETEYKACWFLQYPLKSPTFVRSVIYLRNKSEKKTKLTVITTFKLN